MMDEKPEEPQKLFGFPIVEVDSATFWGEREKVETTKGDDQFVGAIANGSELEISVEYQSTVTFDLRLVREDGDGSACECCGEPCWMNQHRVTLFASGGRPDGHGLQQVLCDGCFELVEFDE